MLSKLLSRSSNVRSSFGWCLRRYLLIRSFLSRDSAYRQHTVRLTSSMHRVAGGSPAIRSKRCLCVRCHLLRHSPPSWSSDFMGALHFLLKQQLQIRGHCDRFSLQEGHEILVREKCCERGTKDSEISGNPLHSFRQRQHIFQMSIVTNRGPTLRWVFRSSLVPLLHVASLIG